MRRFLELPFSLSAGVDTYNPSVTSTNLQFLRLKNIQPRQNRLTTPNGFKTIQELEASGGIVGFASYTEPVSLYSSLYALSPTEVYPFNFSSQLFGASIYSSFADNNERYTVVPWYDKVYVSKLDQGTVKLEAGVATLVDGIPAGRYAISSNSHLMYANISTPSGRYPSRVQWSDLYNPENFTIDTNSQADYFDTEQSDGEITGLSYQRGNNLLYVRNTVWIATFNASTGGYSFEPLFTGIGNMYHHAQVRVKELDIFISVDGIYVIDGLQLKSIGDPIWSFFKSDIDDSDLSVPVVGTLDLVNYEVFWTYLNKEGNYWQIVYNYKEDKWSDRDPQGETSRFRIDQPLRGYDPIDSYNTGTVDADSRTIDGSWQYTTFIGRELIGGRDGNVYSINNDRFHKVDGTTFECELESADFFFDKTDHTKEIHSALLQHSRVEQEEYVPEEPPAS